VHEGMKHCWIDAMNWCDSERDGVLPDQQDVLMCLRNHRDNLGDHCGKIMDEFDEHECEPKMHCWGEIKSSVDACLDDTKELCPHSTHDLGIWHMCLVEHASKLDEDCKQSGAVVHQCFKEHPDAFNPLKPRHKVVFRHKGHHAKHADGTDSSDSETTIRLDGATVFKTRDGQPVPLDQFDEDDGPPAPPRHWKDIVMLSAGVAFAVTALTLLFLTCFKHMWRKFRERRQERFIPLDDGILGLNREPLMDGPGLPMSNPVGRV